MIAEHLAMAQRLARRFARRSDAIEDLQQVAALGLIKAVDGFRPDLGAPFAPYAVSTIMGELKRHQRDHAWDVRAPRRVQELYLSMQHEVETLTQELGRAPRPREIADRLQVGEEDVLEAIEAASGLHCASLDTTSPDDGLVLAERLGTLDKGLELVDGRVALVDALRHIPARQRWILKLHYFDGLTQAEVAREVGLSQMQVSRLIQSALETLRRHAGPGQRGRNRRRVGTGPARAGASAAGG